VCDGDRCRAPGTRQCLVTSTLRAVASGRLTRTLRLALIPSHLSRVAWVVFGCLVALGAVGWFLVPLVLGVLGPLGWVARWFGWWSPGRARFPLVRFRVLGSWGARLPGSPSVASK